MRERNEIPGENTTLEQSQIELDHTCCCRRRLTFKTFNAYTTRKFQRPHLFNGNNFLCHRIDAAAVAVVVAVFVIAVVDTKAIFSKFEKLQSERLNGSANRM